MYKQISIIGGGIAGLTTAIALNEKGYKTRIFEQAGEIRALGAGLALGANAIMAFDRIGIKDEVIARGRILPSFNILDRKGRIITRTDSQKMGAKYGIDNFTIHRAELHQLLLSRINPETIYSSKKVTDMEQHADSVKVFFEDGSVHETDCLVAADGIHSLFRKKLVPASEERYAGYTCWRAVIDNTTLNLSDSSETWGPGKRFGIVPLANNKIYWFACMNAGRNDSRLKNYSVEDIAYHFRDFHDPVENILSETRNENLLWNDIIDLKPITRYAYDNILLIGDAAHATTPNMGQGACQAIEDAVVLADELSRNNEINEAFLQFEKRRLKRTHYITNTSWKIGKIAQLDNKLLSGLRNLAFRMAPSGFGEKQLKKLYQVDF